MRERDLAGSKHQVDEWNVGQEGNECGLEEETEIGVAVVHALLGEGEVSGLADEQVSPLHTHDGDEVSTLSVPETFDGVADLSFVHVRGGVESHELIWLPSALGPGIWLQVEVEQTQVEHVVCVTVPVELDDLRWPFSFNLGELTIVSDQVLTSCLVGWFGHLHEHGSSLDVRVASERSNVVRGVLISVAWNNTWLCLETE